jgi:phosphoribosyl-AMP cyclohydrolase
MNIKFDKEGFIPTIIQNTKGTVLYLQSSNKDSLTKMIETGTVWRYSRSQDKLIQTGESSGKIEYVQGIYRNCYKDTLLVKVEQSKPYACHKGFESCFAEELQEDGSFKQCLEQIIDPQKMYKE